MSSWWSGGATTNIRTPTSMCACVLKDLKNWYDTVSDCSDCVLAVIST